MVPLCAQILKERDQGLSAPLKVYHNTVKRLLIQRFASDADRLLDLACGRGGDLRKWVDVGIKYVKGYDQAECEVSHRQPQLALRGCSQPLILSRPPTPVVAMVAIQYMVHLRLWCAQHNTKPRSLIE